MIKLCLFFATFLTTLISAQNNYETYMQNALEHKDYETLTLKLEEVQENYPNEWLPSYYLAFHTINNSFLHLKNEAILKEELIKAQGYLDHAYVGNYNKAELLVLQAKLFLVYVISNSEKYGRTYAPVISKLNSDAYLLAPENPRVVLNKAQWDIGSAKYFGANTEKFCADLQTALKQFEIYKSKEDFAPEWGLDETKQALKDCNK